MARNKRKNRIANTLAVCFWLCAWQAASVCIGQKLILVSPLEVCGALLALLPTADFWQTAAFSAGRIIGGFLLALALGLALLAPVGFALLGQMAGARDGALAALNAAFFRRARMENVSACLLLGAGLFLRAALPGGEKRA